ncbi:DUF3619 family protein [Roseateles sp. BYS180W]|uniref:DUF3619 family protein n=1 Tax=Roseateles rivi TaxID=3299028 RepID=A0ABW7FVX7_9BURK
MNHTQTNPATSAQDTLQNRVGQRLASCLNEQAAHLPADIEERLRFAREQAMSKAAAARAAQPLAAADLPVLQASQSTLVLGQSSGSGPRWLKLAALVPALLLALGLVVIHHSQWYEQIRAAAELDTGLLSKPLPPAAYNDPGFREYLNEDPNATEEDEQ